MTKRTYTPTEVISNLGGTLTQTRLNNESIREVTTLSEVNKAVHVSDIHLGHESHHNPRKFADFMSNVVSKINPDLLIVAGDFLEFWRSSIESVLTNYREQISTLLSLLDTTQVALIAGNHDYRLIDLQADIIVTEGVRFKSGDTMFKSIHGHNYDAKNSNNYSNEGLCLTSDETGAAMDKYWDAITGVLPFKLSFNRATLGAPNTATPFGPVQHLSDPDVLARESQSRRRNTIRRAVEADNEEYVLYGHTHSPYVGEDSANSGSFTSNSLTYLVVDDGDVELREY